MPEKSLIAAELKSMTVFSTIISVQIILLHTNTKLVATRCNKIKVAGKRKLTSKGGHCSLEPTVQRLIYCAHMDQHGHPLGNKVKPRFR